MDADERLRFQVVDNPAVVCRALTTLLEALVLHEVVVAGPDNSVGVAYFDKSKPLRRANACITESEPMIPLAYRFLLLGVARRQAIDLLDHCGESLVAALDVTGATLDPKWVRRHLVNLRPEAADISPHKIADYIYDAHFLDVMWQGLIRKTWAATYGHSASDAMGVHKQFFGDFLRGNVDYPDDNPDDFFAAHLLFRTVAYLLMAEVVGAAYHADPLRAPVVRAISAASSTPTSFATTVVRRVEQEEAAKDAAVNADLGYEAFSVPVPIVAHAVLSKVQRRDQILDAAVDLRESKAAIRFRRYCANVDEALAAGDRTKVELALQDLAKAGVAFGDAVTVESESGAWDATSAKELVALKSPLAAALVGALRYPADRVVGAWRHRRYALLDELRSPPRITHNLGKRFESLWPAEWPPPERPLPWGMKRD